MSSSEDHEEGKEGADGDQSGQGGEAVVPEGMRVVRKRKKRKSEASRQTLYLKKKEILREMQSNDDSVGVKEQMDRLIATQQEGVPLEEKWGSASHRRRGSRWVILAVLGVAVPIIAIFLVISLTKGTPGVTPSTTGSFLDLDEPEVEISAFDKTGPVAWFHENSVTAFEKAQRLLGMWDDSVEPRQLNEVLRDAERVTRILTVEDLAATPDYITGDLLNTSWEYGNARDTGFLVVMGRSAAYTPYRAYFVKTDEGLRLDWEATSAQCEVPVVRLAAEAPTRPVLVRGWLGKQPYYDTETGRGSTRSWYIVLDADKENFVWGYAPTKSQLDLQMRDLLAYGRMVEERMDEVRVTLRLTRPSAGFREGEFEITELVTPDWVMP